MTRKAKQKAAPFARHLLPPPGSPVCVCLPCQAAAGVGGRLAGCAGHPGPSPPPDAGRKARGVFSALGEVCSLLKLEQEQGRKHGSLGGEKPSGTWAHFTLSPVTSHLHPS